MRRLCLSPLTVTDDTIDGILFFGLWYLTGKILSTKEKGNISFNVAEPHIVTQSDYYIEAETSIN